MCSLCLYFKHTALWCIPAWRRHKISNSTPKVAYFCNFLSSLASDIGLQLNNWGTLKIKQMVSPERWTILLYVSYLVQIILILICPHPTVLQTSATNRRFWEVAKFSTEGTVMNCQTGKYIQYQNKNKPYYMKERLISYQFHVLDWFIYVQFDHTFPCCIVVKAVKIVH